jgi:integrase
MARHLNKLTQKQVSALLKPDATLDRYGDGGGLYAQITETGKSWVYRFELHGEEHWMGLGSLRDVPLDDAREDARVARNQRRKGINPLDVRAAERAKRALESAKQIDFQTATREYFKGHEQKWSNVTHRQQFLSSLQTYAFPWIGKLPVAKIDTAAVLEVLRPIWFTKSVTAGRVRNRIEAVLDWATASGYRSGSNPGVWNGHLEAILPAKAKIVKVTHHAAMPYTDVPAFIDQLPDNSGVGSFALEFLILTAARSSEAIRAQWPEFDLDARVWTIPAERIKGRKPHRVLEILNSLPREGDFIFPGARKGRPLGQTSLWDLVSTMGLDVTVHGFRSSFRDWCAERTNFPREIIEQCLAHAVGNHGMIQFASTQCLCVTRQSLPLPPN